MNTFLTLITLALTALNLRFPILFGHTAEGAATPWLQLAVWVLPALPLAALCNIARYAGPGMEILDTRSILDWRIILLSTTNALAIPSPAPVFFLLLSAFLHIVVRWHHSLLDLPQSHLFSLRGNPAEIAYFRRELGRAISQKASGKTRLLRQRIAALTTPRSHAPAPEHSPHSS